MSPFTLSQTGLKVSHQGRSAALPAIVTFAFCTVLGLGAVYWRTQGTAASARSAARRAVQAQSLAIERELDRAVTATEVLAALGRQTGGAIPNFQRVAADLLAAHPGVSSLELEPGGVVSEIWPRTSQDHRLGWNVLNDSVEGVGARQAILGRSLMVCGPVWLGRGVTAIVARAPIFVRGRDGRDVFWGFVSASQFFSDALARSGVDELRDQGYGYVMFVPGLDGQKAVLITGRGRSSFPDSVQQPFRVGNLRLCLAVQRQGGWINLTKAAAESVAVLVLSGFAALLVNLLEVRRAMEESLAETNRRLAQEGADRKELEAERSASKESIAALDADLGRARAALEQAQARAVELQASLDAAERKAAELGTTSQAKLKKAQADASEIQTRHEANLRAAERALQGREAELAQERLSMEALRLANQALLAQIENLRAHHEDTAARSEAQLAEAQSALARALAESEAVRRSSSQELAAKEAELEKARVEIQDLRPESSVQRAAEAPVGSPGHQPSAETVAPIPVSLASVDSPVLPAANSEPPPAPSAAQDSAGSTILPEAPGLRPSSPEVSSDSEVAPAAPSPSPSEPTPQGRPARVSKRKKDLPQMDLFGGGTPGDGAQPPTAASPSVSSPPPSDPEALTVEILLPRLLQAQVAPEPTEPPPEGIPASLPVPSPSSEAPPSDAQASSFTPADNPTGPNESIAPNADAIPAIAGVATAQGLDRAGGDVKVFLKALRHFAENQAAVPERIRDALVQGHSTTAHQVLVSLGHAANEIGALGIQAAADKLARGIQEGSEPADLEFLWADLDQDLKTLMAELKAAIRLPGERAGAAHPPTASQPINLAQWRKAFGLMLPLLSENDPGAKDCLKHNRAIFRSAFSAEGFAEFENLANGGEFAKALDQLKKAARKHGI